MVFGSNRSLSCVCWRFVGKRDHGVHLCGFACRQIAEQQAGQEGARESAVDPVAFEETYQFYVDADTDKIPGYRLVYRDSEGLFFVREELYEAYFR